MKLEKITEQSKRRYEDACGTAHALEILGERWALLIMRELMLGPKRFGDLRAGLPGLSANVLTQRLDGLEANGVLRRRRLPPPASVQVYELTDWGLEAEAVIKTMGHWAARSPAHDPTLPLSPASLMLSFRTMFDAEKARGVRVSVRFEIGEEAFLATVVDGRLRAVRSEAGDPASDVVIVARPETVAAMVYGGAPPEVLEADGVLSLHGDRRALAAFRRLFSLPPKASAA